MKEALEKVKSELRATLQLWNNEKSTTVKIALIMLFIALVSLKIFTTILTFDWLVDLF